VESNQIDNSLYGISWGGVGASNDLVLRKNMMVNVPLAFYDSSAYRAGINRIILLSNTAQWPAGASYSAPKGIYVNGNHSSSTTYYKSVIARGNVFRRPVGDTPNGNEIGLYFKNCTNVIAENNVSDVGSVLDNGVRYEVCSKVKAFNNKTVDAVFAPVYYITGQTHLGELTTDVEDALLAI
jgi:hypothetical protein